MTTYGVVIALDVIERFEFCFRDITKCAVFEQFRFVARKQTFRVGVIVRFTRTAHALLEAVGHEQSAKLSVHVLPAAITVNQQAARRFNAYDGLLQSANDEARFHVARDGPSDDLARIQIEPGRQISPLAGQQRQVRDVNGLITNDKFCFIRTVKLHLRQTKALSTKPL